MAKETQFEEKVARTLLVLLGITAVVFGVFLSNASLPENCDYLALPLSIAFFTLGIILLSVGILSSKSTAIWWAGNSTSHEVMIIFVLLAYGVASIIPDKN